MKRTLSIAVVLALTLASSVPVRAAEPDDLKFFEEEAKVITASKREQTAAEIPLATDVVTAEEIKASGAVNIWDLLRFRVGMDVIDGRSTDGNRVVVSARGFPSEYSNNLLVLVDGRSVYNASVAGVYWEQLPVQLQDIERIEILRGPGTALYGTGAGVGVVNIITKKPTGRAALELDTRGGSRGLIQAFQAVEVPAGKAAFRVSHTFQQDDAFPHSGNSAAPDDPPVRKNVLNLRANVPLSELSDLEFMTGRSWSGAGLIDNSNSAAILDRFDVDFQTVKLTHRFSENSSVEATSTRNSFISGSPDLSITGQDLRQLQYDEEVLHRMTWWNERLNTTYGVSYRNVQVTAPGVFGALRPRLEIYRGYLHQNVKLSESLAVLGAFSEESSNIAGPKPNYQLASVWNPAPAHALRASYSVSYTLRALIPIFGDYQPSPTLRIVGDPQNNTIPYKITSYETGYHGTYLNKHLEADASLFYTNIANFQDASRITTFPPLLTTLTETIDDSAIARGTELSLKYRFASARSVYANYTYEHITDQAGSATLRSRNTPANKLNFGGMTGLGRGFSASANVGYKDSYVSGPTGSQSLAPIPAYWRLDARLAYTLPWYKDAELYAAGQNLLQPGHLEYSGGLIVARTLSGGVAVKF